MISLLQSVFDIICNSSSDVGYVQVEDDKLIVSSASLTSKDSAVKFHVSWLPIRQFELK